MFRALQDALDAPQLMLVALALLASTIPLVHWTRSSVPANERGRAADAGAPSNDTPLGGFSVIARDRYLLLIALLIVLLNCVSTMGDYLLTGFVVSHAEQQVASDASLDKGQLIGEFYASFYLAVNVLTVVIQMFVVGRLFRWIGVNGALLLLPIVALVGYGVVAFVPIFALLRVVKVCEYSGNYSVLNTARQALFLPLSTKRKFEGKIATDTFFWRFGDLIPAVIVFIGVSWLDFGAQEFAVVNMALSAAWLAVALLLARHSPEQTSSGPRRPFAHGATAAYAAVRRLSVPVLAIRASSWLAAAVGVFALAGSGPAGAAADGSAGAAPPGVFDDRRPLEMELVYDSKALCRDPRQAACADLPATLLYRDAEGRQQRVPVALRTRGRYRADTVQCSLPALFVFFTGETRGTLFAGESMLPLTTHCDRSAQHEQYLLKEYLGYRIYESLTSKSLHVRLVRMIYRDAAAGRLEPIERYAFFTEHFDSFARRQGVTVRPKGLFDPRSGDPAEITTLDLFQYAIGNTDWSVVKGHNVLLVEGEGARVTPVPFDFDFSGLVDAEYASVSPEVSIRTVRQRVFRGVCDPDTDWDAAFAHFAARRDDVLRLADEIPDLQPRQRLGAVDYLDDAFATFASAKRRRTLIVDACRSGAAR